MEASPLAQRLRKVMEGNGLNAAQWNRRAGVSPNLLYELYAGRTKTMAHQTLVKLAEAVGMTVSELTGEVEPHGVKPNSESAPAAKKILSSFAERGDDLSANFLPPSYFLAMTAIQVVGDVQAGAWMEALERGYDEPLEIYQKLSPRYRDVAFGLRVLGQSMNLKFPEGTILVCVPASEYGQAIKSKDYVIMLRRNGSGQVEATVKRYLIEGKKHYLCPQSDDPHFQERFELPAPLSDPLAQDEYDIWIHAVVLSHTEELPAARR
jgi:SOS-response transcriptional repressor LexA